MSSTATITTKTKNNVLAVPLESIVEREPSASASQASSISVTVPTTASAKPKTQTVVYLIEGNKVRFVEVTSGVTDESYVEISSGLKAGQEISTGPKPEQDERKRWCLVVITNEDGATSRDVSK